MSSRGLRLLISLLFAGHHFLTKQFRSRFPSRPNPPYFIHQLLCLLVATLLCSPTDAVCSATRLHNFLHHRILAIIHRRVIPQHFYLPIGARGDLFIVSTAHISAHVLQPKANHRLQLPVQPLDCRRAHSAGECYNLQ